MQGILVAKLMEDYLLNAGENARNYIVKLFALIETRIATAFCKTPVVM